MGTFGELNRTYTDTIGIFRYELVDVIKQEFVKKYVLLF